MKLIRIELLLVLFWLCALRSRACGPDFPNNLLDSGDAAVLQAPVADFRNELVRMKLAPPAERAVPLADGQKFSEQSTELEMADLAAALKRERISSALATTILQAQLAERMKLNAFIARQDAWTHYDAWVWDTNGYHTVANTNPPPVFPEVAVTPGMPREFADYFAGAIAWHNHDALHAEQCWQQVLALPAAERHFKSIWAAYMLAQNDERLPSSDDDQALGYYEQVRALARQGFADSAGLAIASVGGEAQIWLRRKNFERAIELYLEQFAAGDESAVNSLRFTAARAVMATNSTAAELKTLALNPRTRRVITAYLISRNPYSDRHEADSDAGARQFFDQTDGWLAAVEAADIKDVASASSLALAAYQASRMDIAERWVRRAGHEPVAQWLQAKLWLRDGKIAAAAKLLARLSRDFPRLANTNSLPAGLAGSLLIFTDEEAGDSIPMNRQVLGELGVLHLTRREYTESLDALLRSGYWMDAAYVAEDVLTVEELKTYVDRNWPLAKAQETADIPDWVENETANPGGSIRWLLARRLARESMADTAHAYYPTNFQGNFESCRAALLAGRDKALSPAERAKNLVAAAFITRTNGLELFGTELSPDWGIYGGTYAGGLAMETRTNEHAHLVLPGPDEFRRAAQSVVTPNIRFHYRFQAADLAMEAAQLMPDNADETAQLLCTAGTWIKILDPTHADVFYKALVRRCRKTAIGAAAEALRWFPILDEAGNPIPYKPRVARALAQPEFDSIHMMDRQNGWAQNASSEILATTNGGERWRAVLVASTNQSLNGCFEDATNAWVASFYYDDDTNVTILKTGDGGRSWSHNQFGSPCSLTAAFPACSDIYAVWLMVIPDRTMNSSPGYLYFIPELNDDWKQINNTEGGSFDQDNSTSEEFARPHSFLSCGGETCWLDHTNGWLLGSMTTTTPPFLFGTADGGHTWQLQTLPLPDSLHDGQMVAEGLPKVFRDDGLKAIMGASFKPNDPDSTNAWLVIFATQDGGQTWQTTTPVEHGEVWDFISEKIGWIWQQGPVHAQWTDPVKGSLNRTDDGGTTWQPVCQTHGLAALLTQRDHVVQVDFVDQDCGWVLIQQWNDLPTRLLRTTDGGQTWNDLPFEMQR